MYIKFIKQIRDVPVKGRRAKILLHETSKVSVLLKFPVLCQFCSELFPFARASRKASPGLLTFGETAAGLPHASRVYSCSLAKSVVREESRLGEDR